MFEIQKKVGDDGDFQTLEEALKSEETGVTLLISSEKGISHSFLVFFSVFRMMSLRKSNHISQKSETLF